MTASLLPIGETIPAGQDPRWPGGRPAAAMSAFSWKAWPLQADWSDVIRSTKNSYTASDTVERQRAEGKQVGTIALMGRGPKQSAMVSIENREAGERSRDRLAALRRSAI